jgi:cytoskeleton protein RodZ
LKNNEHQHDGEFFIGARLAAKRQKAGIAIDKAAKDTRIPVERLRQIESDDFSSFAHPTYARLFLIDYANYLRVPLDDIREYLPGTANLGSPENAYLHRLLEKPGFLEGDQFKSIRRLLIALGAIIAILLVGALGFYFWRTWEKFERVKPAASPKAEASPTATPSTESTEPAEDKPIIITPEMIQATEPPLPSLMDDQVTKPSPLLDSALAPAPSGTPLTTLPPFELSPATPRTKRP